MVTERLVGSPARRSAVPTPFMTVIVEGGAPNDQLRRCLEAIQHSTVRDRTELAVVCSTPWPDAPAGVRVVVSNSASRGDRLDRASEGATGELLAFINDCVALTAGWQARAVELFADPSVGAAGGPHLLPSNATSAERAAWLILSSRLGSGPLAYRFKRAAARDVFEMPTTNMIVRGSAFDAVGGFQSPSPLGDDARLCYKLRTLLGLRVVFDPGLAVEGPPPALQRPYLSQLIQWGRKRGDLARRLPETCEGLPYPLPALWLLALCGLALAMIVSPLAKLGLLAAIALYAAAGVWMLLASHDLRAGAKAALGLPLSHLAYAVGFWGGFLGPNLADATPGRFRQTPRRILITNWRDITHPWAGGAEAYMHEIARRWVRDGCDVGWLCGKYHGAKREELVDGIRVHRVGGHFTLYPLAALTYLLRLRRRYDVIVDCENGIPFFTPLYSRKPVVLVVFHVHAEVFRTELPKYLSRIALFMEGWLMPRVYRKKEVLTISDSSRHDLESGGWDRGRITIVKSGVELPLTTRLPQRSDTPLLVCLGRLKRYKSVHILLRAMPEVLRRFPGAKLAIVGQGPDRARLERIAWRLGLASSVRFCGYLDRRTRDHLLAQAWVAVCPSAFEGFGVICLEANAVGTAVVASRVAGLKDAVVDGKTGLLVPHGQSGLLAQSLIALLDDPSLRMEMGRAGREWAGAHTWDASSRAFLQKVIAVMPSSVGVPVPAVTA